MKTTSLLLAVCAIAFGSSCDPATNDPAAGWRWWDRGYSTVGRAIVGSPSCWGVLYAPHLFATSEFCEHAAYVELQDLENTDKNLKLPVHTYRSELSVQGGSIGLGIDLTVLHLDLSNLSEAQKKRLNSAELISFHPDLISREFKLYSNNRNDGTAWLTHASGKTYENVWGSEEAFVNAYVRRYDQSKENAALRAKELYEYSELVPNHEGILRHQVKPCQGQGVLVESNDSSKVLGFSSWTPIVDYECAWFDVVTLFGPTAMAFLRAQEVCGAVQPEGECIDEHTLARCFPSGSEHPVLFSCDSGCGRLPGDRFDRCLSRAEDPCSGLPSRGQCEHDAQGQSFAVRCTTPDEVFRERVRVNCSNFGAECRMSETGAACVN